MFKLIIVLCLFILPVIAERIPVYLGSGGKHISLVYLDDETGELLGFKKIAETGWPSSLTISADRKKLYSVGSERGKPAGVVVAFSIQADKSLTEINRRSSMGAGACHVSMDRDSQCVFVANYSGGCVASYQVQAGGGLSEAVSHIQHEGSSVNIKRQKRPHAHSIYASPDGKFVYAADLGTDDVFIYYLDSDTGIMKPAGSAKVPLGGGPRHMAFSKHGDRLFVVNEMLMTVSEFARDADKGGLTLLKTKPVMAMKQENMSCSEIQLSPDGRHLYIGCRDHLEKQRDVISVMKVEDLSIVQEHAAGVWIPRHFALSPCGEWMLVAGQKGNKVSVHKRNLETGLLELTEHHIEAEKPMWVLFP